VIREFPALGEDLRRGVRNIKEVVIFDEERLTEEGADPREGDRGPHRALEEEQIASRKKLIGPTGKAKASAARTLWLIAREKFLSRAL